jgi:hypothetical protein
MLQKVLLAKNNLKILRPKVKKNLTNFQKKFCESPPCSLGPVLSGKERINMIKYIVFTFSNKITYFGGLSINKTYFHTQVMSSIDF